MLKFKFIFQLAVLMLIPALSIGQNIHIKVFNKTGYDLDSVSFNHFYLGNISKDSTVFLSDIKEITMQGDVPLHIPFGIIEGKKRPFNLTPCGTKSKKKKAGRYAFDIFIYETGNEYRLYWKKHE
jgi:c-di-AMP phosphodiesterase-like protein